ncbi:MAG TPA: hypothetical protein VFK86_18025 [Bauldia sp.]|nr:hypothetical protein [Bauldia sp.]
MTNFGIHKALIAAGAVVGLAGAALAQDLPDDLRLDGAWEDLVVDQEPILTDVQFAKLNNLAFQAAVTKICDGYELDQAKFAEGLSDATYPSPATVTTPDDMKHWETAVYFRLGASYGIFLAEGNAHPDAFCANAAELKADAEVPNVWR